MFYMYACCPAHAFCRNAGTTSAGRFTGCVQLAATFVIAFSILVAMKTYEPGQQDIETVIAKLNSHKNQLGAYISHNKTAEDDYLVTLSNGRIRLYTAELKDADKLLPYRFPDMLARYIPAAEYA